MNKTLKDRLKAPLVYGTILTYSLGINGCATQKALEHADSNYILRTSSLFLECRDKGYLSETGIKRAQNIIDTGDNKQIVNLYNELYGIKKLSEKKGVESDTLNTNQRIPVKRDYGTSGLETKTADIDTTATAKADSLLEKACEETLDAKEEAKPKFALGDSVYAVELNEAKQKKIPAQVKEGYGIFSTMGEERIKKKPEGIKEVHWYDTGIFANNYVRGAGAVLGIAGISFLVSELNKPKSDKGKQNTPKNEYGLPEEEANIGVGGGHISEGSEIGVVRGGTSNDNSEIGGIR